MAISNKYGQVDIKQRISFLLPHWHISRYNGIVSKHCNNWRLHVYFIRQRWSLAHQDYTSRQRLLLIHQAVTQLMSLSNSNMKTDCIIEFIDAMCYSPFGVKCAPCFCHFLHPKSCCTSLPFSTLHRNSCSLPNLKFCFVWLSSSNFRTKNIFWCGLESPKKWLSSANLSIFPYNS